MFWLEKLNPGIMVIPAVTAAESFMKFRRESFELYSVVIVVKYFELTKFNPKLWL
jgi:hypothetical protein